MRAIRLALALACLSVGAAGHPAEDQPRTHTTEKQTTIATTSLKRNNTDNNHTTTIPLKNSTHDTNKKKTNTITNHATIILPQPTPMLLIHSANTGILDTRGIGINNTNRIARHKDDGRHDDHIGAADWAITKDNCAGY